MDGLRMYCHFCRGVPLLQGTQVIQIRRNTYYDGGLAAARDVGHLYSCTST
jgi:hypothetical protein